jgi:hypothetical protein
MPSQGWVELLAKPITSGAEIDGYRFAPSILRAKDEESDIAALAAQAFSLFDRKTTSLVPRPSFSLLLKALVHDELRGLQHFGSDALLFDS